MIGQPYSYLWSQAIRFLLGFFVAKSTKFLAQNVGENGVTVTVSYRNCLFFGKKFNRKFSSVIQLSKRFWWQDEFPGLMSSLWILFWEYFFLESFPCGGVFAPVFALKPGGLRRNGAASFAEKQNCAACRSTKCGQRQHPCSDWNQPP